MEVDIKVIKETQKSLGKLIKRPQLTDKLLQKPPFRFLHDIVKAIIKETGFLAGLFNPDELEYENVKDKESKMAFLTKLIEVVKIASAKNLTVRPSKIIAGLEAAKTNELLQTIALCVDQKIDSKIAIDKYKKDFNNEVKPVKIKEKVIPSKSKFKPGKSNDPTENIAKKVVEKSRKTDKVSEKKVKTTTNKLKTSVNSAIHATEIEVDPISDCKTEDDKDSIKEFKKLEAEAEKHVAIQEQKSDKGATFNNGESTEQITSTEQQISEKRRKSLTKADSVDLIDMKTIESIQKDTKLRLEEEDQLNNQESLPVSEPEKQSLEQNEKFEKIESSQEPITTNKTIDGGRQSRLGGRRQSIDIVPDVSNKRETSAAQNNKFIRNQSEDKMIKLRPQSVRPPSARPGAPKRRDKTVEIVLQPEEIVKPSLEIINKIDALEAELEDNVDNLVIIEDPNILNDDGIIPKANDSLSDVIGEKEGALVHQILETQREFSNAGMGDFSNTTNETLWESPFDSRHFSLAKTEALRDSIQKLTKSVNPLGKLLDFMQEDVDSMQIELTQQLELYQMALIDMENEKAATEMAIQPFKQQLQQLQENIKYYHTAILDVRTTILNNEQKLIKKFNEF
uniref:TRAF3-interacting protein 1 n=1 Tax=Culicoides sonorensis TaxID=179676 RepID=A0A336LJ82_CULSO